MKQDILKISGAKSLEEFYYLYPTEEAFKKAFPKEFKKAKMGASMVKKQLTQLTDFANPPQAQVGIQQFGLQKPNFNYNVAAANKQMFGGYDFNKGLADQYVPQVKPGEFANRTRNEVSASAYDTTGMPKYANSVGKSQTPAAPKDPSTFSSVLNNAGDIYGGFQQAKQDRQNLLKSKQFNELSKVGLLATQSRPERMKNKYVRPEDMAFDPNQMYPSYGTNANVLAKDGKKVGGNKTEIQNTYAPGSLYDNLGYEPLNDSAQNGGFFGNWKGDLQEFGADNAGGFGTMLGSAIGGGNGAPSGASKIGGGIGSIAGTAIGGPLGGVIGKGIGSLAGGIIGGAQQRRTEKFNKLGMENVKQAAFQSGMQGMQQNQFGAFMEDGGEVGLKYLSHDWQPQVITKFGDYNVKDLLREDPTMDTLRSGGSLKHPRDLTQRALQTYDMGGELSVDDRGDIDFMGYNPETAKTGASGYVGITRGPSHDNGGFNIDYNGNKVEVEGNETVMEQKDGGSINGDTALNILGNMKIGDFAKDVTEDVDKQTLKTILKGKDLKNMKYKHVGNAIAKRTKSLNEAESKYVDMADSADEDDLIALNTAKAGKIGIDMQYKGLNNFQTGLVTVQNAKHDVAKQYGYSDTPKFLEDVKKGKVQQQVEEQPYQQAAMGGKFTKAQDGTKKSKYDPEFETFIDQAMQLEQANSSQSGDYRGGGNYFGTNNSAYNTPEKAKKYYYENYWSKVKDLPPGLRTRALQLAINTGDPYGELMVASGKMSVDRRRDTKNQRKDKSIVGNKDWEKNKASILKEYNKDPQAFLAKLDTEQNRYYDSLVKANTDAAGKTFGSIDPNTSREFYDDYLGLANFAAQPFIQKPTLQQAIQQSAQQSVVPIQPLQQPPAAPTNIPAQRNIPIAPAQSPASRQPMPPSSQANVQTPPVNPALRMINPMFVPKNIYMQPSRVPLEQMLPSPMDESGNYYMPGYQPYGEEAPMDAEAEMPQADLETSEQVNPYNFLTSFLQNENARNPLAKKLERMDEKLKNKKEGREKEKEKTTLGDVLKGARTLLPYLRGTNQEAIDPNQFSGEMLALATNQLQPVQAQQYIPQLETPYSISFQDQMNANQADFNAMQRQYGYNPAAASQLAAQKYAANSSVLGQQARTNQEMQMGAYNRNRGVLNDSTIKNLAILDNQYQRQEQAKSNTKMQAQVALNSIASKIAQHKLQNRTLGIQENMYNYRFGPNGRAYNVNAPYEFDMQGNGSYASNGLPTLPEGLEYKTTIEQKKKTKETARNGSIVKAIKNL